MDLTTFKRTSIGVAAKIVDGLARKQHASLEGGGEERRLKQRQKGKLAPRERIRVLLDHGTSFNETDMLVEHRCTNFSMNDNLVPGDGVVTGYGAVNERLVGISSQDFTVYGGSLGEMHAKKICKAMDLAADSGLPFVAVNDSGGARIQEGIDSLSGYGEIFRRNVDMSGCVPQISVILGPCAGGAVYSPALTDFIVMTRGAYMFVTGPDVIKKVTFEDLTQEMLGGASVHGSKTGVADIIANNEIDALLLTRKLLTYLPQNCREKPAIIACSDSPHRRSLALESIVPHNPLQSYDMKEIATAVLDEGEFFEVGGEFAKNILTGFGRIGGMSVGVVANQPMHLAGCLDINASRKAARFIRFCDAFNIPIVTLVDVPGFMPGTNQEHNGIITHGAKLLYAYAEATVPKITVITRKAYGGAYIVMGSSHLGGDINYAWPSAEVAVMGVEGAVEIIFRKHASDKSKLKQLSEEYKELFVNPTVSASRGYVNEVISPADTRSKIYSALVLLKDKQSQRRYKKHDNLPL
jgi:propionyl-CoA carboxylase beta chain